MKSRTNIKDNCFFDCCIYFNDKLYNEHLSSQNKKYTYELGKQNYNKIEEIRYRNESILSILDSCVSAGSVNNIDLFTLYRNYSKISEVELSLWSNYLNSDNSIFMNKRSNSKNIVLNTTSKNELYSEIEELLYSYIQNDMTEKIDVIELKGKVLTDFKQLKDMATDLNNYFTEFYSKNCNVPDSKKEKTMIQEDYWVDILQGMQEVNNKYVEYEFVY